MAQSLRHARCGRGDHKAALGRDVAAAHGSAMDDARVVRQRGEIDFVEDRKGRELRGRIGENVGGPEGQKADNGKYSHRF